MLISMDAAAINSKAWDREATCGSAWAQIVSEKEIDEARRGNPGIRVTVNRNVPHSWIEPLKGSHVLILAGGGGQQTPLMAAYGCSTECVDISSEMLSRDREALKRYGLDAQLHRHDMTDLSIFSDCSFNGVISPVSMNFISDIGKVFNEVHRVLCTGGSFIFGIANPALYLFDDRLLAKGRLKVKYTLPFSDERSLSKKDLMKRIRKCDTVEYSHTLQSILGTLTESGFAITGFFSDTSSYEPIDSFLHDCYLAVQAVRIND